jgi:U3 small nucleolar RNA-associated protein MPP10
MEETDSEVAPLAQLVDILEHPEQRILPLLYTSINPKDRLAKQKTQSELIQVVQHLFQGIEESAKKYHELTRVKPEEQQGKEEESPSLSPNVPPLSGLSQLYVPETSDDQDEAAPLDVETLWGQVELQNNALHKLLKKSINRLAKAPEDIVVLDMGQLSSDEGDDGSSDDDDDDDDDDDSSDDSSEEDDGSDDEDEEAKRIRERMERAMDDAEGDEDEGSDEDQDESAPRAKAKEEKEEELYDPVAEDMKDGFFDLNEMEEYADEEEDYLPQEDYGEADSKKKNKKEPEKKSFHQMQRDGDLLDHSDDDDDEEGLEDLYEEDNEPVARKKYREDEDIEALYSLYQNKEDDSDSEAEDAADMTAADLYGKPNKKHMERYSSKKAKEEIKGDDDSWGEYEFEEDNEGASEDRGRKYAENKSDNEDEDDDGENSEEEEEEEQEPENKKPVDNSRQGKIQDRLRKQTEQLESELLAEKPWQMTGETKSTSRPVNSLLEGTPEFEMASKQAPTITIEHTTNIEEAIKKRIIDEDWDDVVPRELPDVGWHKKRGELPEVSQEKSKLGLGELYEREYLKKAVGYDKDAEEKKTEEDKAKDEMKQLFANLCSKLDGLSNYHFAPRPIADEAEVRTSSAPAIAMEEVLPLHVNDARALAPEEVFGAKRGREGVLRGETEMDQQERKRLRQSKKAARRKTRKDKLADEKLISRLQPGMGLDNPYEKRKMREELQMARANGRIEQGGQDMDDKYGSSGTFFKRLQAEAQQTIKGQPSGEEETKKRSKPKSSALKL